MHSHTVWLPCKSAHTGSQEAKALISQRSFNPRDVFKQREQSFEASDGRSPAASRPGKRHTISKTLDKRQSLEWCIALMFWHPGKLQSPFLSQKSIERETPLQPWRPHTLAASVPPLSPDSPVSPERSYSPAAAPVSPTPPATAGSPVQATGRSVF